MKSYTPHELLQHWHSQQQAYVELRDFRTRTVVMTLKKHAEKLKRPLRILDLGCGPGSLGSAILTDIEDAEVVGVDMDPILLRLATETNTFGNKHVFFNINITEPDWQKKLPHDKFDAVISATALHWLQPEQLAKLYMQLPDSMQPSAVFINADHLFYDEHCEKFLNEISWKIRDDYEADSFAKGIMDWDTWWKHALNFPGWEKEANLWRQHFDKPFDIPKKVSSEFHLSALKVAGFIETNQIYKWFDDSIVFARIPDDGLLVSRSI